MDGYYGDSDDGFGGDFDDGKADYDRYEDEQVFQDHEGEGDDEDCDGDCGNCIHAASPCDNPPQ
jgi:hypothetical protein